MKRLLRLPEVLNRTGLSRSTLYADSGFPRAMKVGQRAVAWDEDEINAWIEAKLEEREAALLVAGAEPPIINPWANAERARGR